MSYNFTTNIDSKYNLLIIPVYNNQKKLSKLYPIFDTDSDNNDLFAFINNILQDKDFSLKYLQHSLLYNPKDFKQKILLIGAGDKSKLDCYKFYNLIKNSISILKSHNYLSNNTSIINFFALLDLNSDENNNYLYKTKQIILASNDANYEIKINKNYNNIFNTDKIKYNLDIFIPEDQISQEIKENYKLLEAINNSVDITKNLANLPPNICTPNFIAEQAQIIASYYNKISIEIIEQKELEEQGFGAFTCISKSSKNHGKIIIIKYSSINNNTPPHALIGKGITFDTGGYSLKPRQAMLGMKYDMCGAASVLGTMMGIAKLDLDLNVVGILACAENMVSKSATRPDDIITSLSGKTIEITNTDAEGRLVLCDAITYATTLEPKAIIDIATLTGAAVVALGDNYTAVMGNNKNLTGNLNKAATEIYDPIWELPLAYEYLSDLDSKFADIKNASSRANAGSIIGGLFLSEFTKEYPWIHLDIAGSSTITNNQEEATGRPVPALLQYFCNLNSAENK